MLRYHFLYPANEEWVTEVLYRRELVKIEKKIRLTCTCCELAMPGANTSSFAENTLLTIVITKNVRQIYETWFSSVCMVRRNELFRRKDRIIILFTISTAPEP